MLSQIQPHFMFNSLTTIMYLCEENPNLARETLEKFSFFLRGTLESIELKEGVSINYELDIVKKYLFVEQQRFGKSLEVEYDIKSEDFFIPVLSIQPIVENAIKHGLMKLPRGGTIHVVSYETETDYCISVVDDGVGFDTSVLIDERKPVGLRNIRERLKVMVNGKLEIESTVGVGTKVLVTIPKEVRK